jgi:peptidoglycan/LPS O-acetylase OafA/YrhL
VRTIRRDIQGLRAVAVLAVIFYHFEIISGGFVGVDIFFVVSGFVITNLIVREAETKGTFKILSFFSRRIRRIIPALSFVTFTVLLGSILLESPSGAQQNTLKVALAGLLFTANFMIPQLEGNYFQAVLGENPLLHLWSLGVEEQFYIVIPFLIYLFLKFIKSGASEKPINLIKFLFILIFIISFSAMILFKFGDFSIPFFQDASNSLFYSPLTRAWEFIVGGFAALSRKKTLKNGRLLYLSGLFLVTVSIFFNLSFNFGPLIYASIACCGTYLMIFAYKNAPLLPRQLLNSHVMNWVGDRSYSLYLWHWPILVFGKLIGLQGLFRYLLIIPIFITADFTFRNVENFFRFGKKSLNLQKKLSLGALATLIPTITLSYLFYQGNQSGWSTEWALGSHEAIQRDCDIPPFKPRECSWGTDLGSTEILVVGDSQAWAIADALIETSRVSRSRVIVAAHNNCPFVAGIDFQPGNHCRDWQMQVLNWLKVNKVEYVVIANATYNDALSIEIASKVINKMPLRYTHVIWTIPPETVPSNLVRRALLLPINSGNRNFERPLDSDYVKDYRKALMGKTDVSLLEVANFLCDEQICHVSKEGKDFYTDENHLSVSGARLLTPYFLNKIS